MLRGTLVPVYIIKRPLHNGEKVIGKVQRRSDENQREEYKEDRVCTMFESAKSTYGEDLDLPRVPLDARTS
jgi:hypothetical protein